MDGVRVQACGASARTLRLLTTARVQCGQSAPLAPYRHLSSPGLTSVLGLLTRN